jgi:predicted lipoprotein with Yx(FWY)xxD motif
MLAPKRSQKEKSRKFARDASRAAVPRRRLLGLVATAAVVVVSLTATAFATSSALTLGSSANVALGKSVVVNPQGRTLYALSPETAKHLLCKSRECFESWPPLTVKSAKAKLKDGPGVKGTLGILRRSNGMLQVTLSGKPLYRFAADEAKGQALGDGIKSFGGTWHAVAASGAASATQPTTPTTPAMPSTPTTPATPTTPTTPTTPAPSPPPYQYPAY